MAALVDDEKDGTTEEELEEAVGTKIAFVCGGYGISINTFHSFLTKNSRLSIR